MGYKLLVSKEAHRDIDEITAYIAKELKNKQAAVRFLEDLENSYRNLAENPLLYALCSNERLSEKGYRKVVLKHYLVLYRIDKTTKSVYVVRVIYGARDYAKLL